MDRPRIVFVCTGNAGRSQMAAAMLRHAIGDAVEVRSAGVRPWPHLHPMTKPTLDRRGLNVGDEHPKGVPAVCDRAIDLVITIGDIAERELPRELPGGPLWIHWNIPDPADFDGTPQSADAFEETAKAIEQNLPEIRRLIGTLAPSGSNRVQPIRRDGKS